MEKLSYLTPNCYIHITAGLRIDPAVIFPHHCRFQETGSDEKKLTVMLVALSVYFENRQ